MPLSTSQPRGRRALRGAAVFVVLLVVLVGLTEVALSRWASPSVDLRRFMFRHEFNLDRWRFLKWNEKALALDDSWQLIDDPSRTDIKGPQEGRPPFDRVDRKYEVTTNSLGYREREIQGRPPDGPPRIFFLGDSVTFGKGVDALDRFSDRLRRRWASRAEVFNLGAQGSTSIKVVRTLEHMLPFEPDLLILQASANDSDQTAWRVATDQEYGKAALRAAYLVDRSQLLLRATYRLLGDPHVANATVLREATAARYADALERFFSLCEARQIRVIVMTLRYSTGEPYGEHVATACAQHPRVCLGSLDIDLDEPARWVAGSPDLDPVRPDPVWSSKVAEARFVDPASLAALFPYHRLFHDIVHPNALANELIAAQLAPFVEDRWPGLSP